MKKTKMPKKRKITPVKQGTSQKIKQLQSQLQRALADYDNLQKRTEKERKEVSQKAVFELVSRFLPVMDILDQSQKHLSDPGIEAALKELKEVLKDQKLAEIKPLDGEKFNTGLHEAVGSKQDGKKGQGGRITRTVLSGWRFIDGPVVRHAKVEVYQK